MLLTEVSTVPLLNLKHKSTSNVLLSLCFVPPVLIALLIFRYGVDLIDWDQWEIALFFIKASRGSLTAADLFAQQAEYRQFFPNLIFVALGWLTHWNIKAEMFVSLLLACLIAFNLYKLSLMTFYGNHSTRVLLMLITTLLVFTPAQFESWLLGEQIIYFMPAVCITTSLCVAYSKLSSPAKLIICLLLAIVSTFSSANGLIIWIVIAPTLFFRSASGWKDWRFAVWVLGLLLSSVIYFNGFQKPAYTPSLSTALYQPLRGLFFFCAFLGAPLMTSNRFLLVAAGLGALFATLFVLSFLYVWKRIEDRKLQHQSTGWLMLGGYSFITAIMVSVGRVGFGLDQSLSSRYITFSVYLLISLLYLVPLLVDDLMKRKGLTRSKSRKRLITVAISALIFLHLLNSAAAIRQMAWMKVRRLESKACLLFINVMPNECLSNGFPELSVLRSRINAINELGLLRPALIKSYQIEDLAPTLGNDGSYGRLEGVTLNEGSFLASGWAGLPNRKEAADAVLLTLENDQSRPIIFAYAKMNVVQPSFKRFFVDNPTGDWRWQKTISIDRAGVTLPVNVSAWAFDATSGKAHKLSGTYTIEANRETRRLTEAETP